MAERTKGFSTDNAMQCTFKNNKYENKVLMLQHSFAPTSCTALFHICISTYSTPSVVYQTSIKTKRWCFILVLVVLHDVMGSYQLVAPNWRPLTLGQRSSGPGSDTGQQWRPRSVSSGAWCCLDTQGYLMMLSQQQPTTSNIITSTSNVMREIEKEAISFKILI